VSDATIEVDRYELLAPIGRGGFGAVYLARHKLTGREVALKLSDPKGDPELVARALNEARIAATIQHPSLVSVYDCGALDDGRIFVVMDRIDGQSLEQLASYEGRLEPARAVALVDQVLSALEVLHARGVVHRDIKPSNVLVRREMDGRESVFLIDFGISKSDERVGGAEPAYTMAGSILGTPGYMPPEQFDARSVDARADLFSVAAVLYRIIAGRAVIECHSITDWLVAVTQQPLPSLARNAPWVQPALAAVVDRTLARDRDARPPNAATMRAWLRSACGGDSAGSLASKTARVEPISQLLPPAASNTARAVVASPSVSTELRSAAVADTIATTGAAPRRPVALVLAAAASVTIGVFALLDRSAPSSVEDDTTTVTNLDPAHRAALAASSVNPANTAPAANAMNAAPAAPVANAVVAPSAPSTAPAEQPTPSSGAIDRTQSPRAPSEATGSEEQPTQSSALPASPGPAESDVALLSSTSGRLRLVSARPVGDVDMQEVLDAVRSSLTTIEACRGGAGHARASITIMFRSTMSPVFSEPASQGGALARCVEVALTVANPRWRSGTRSGGILADAEFVWR